MSSAIVCPRCDTLVTETGWGHEDGEYNCDDCDTEFTVTHGKYGLEYEV